MSTKRVFAAALLTLLALSGCQDKTEPATSTSPEPDTSTASEPSGSESPSPSPSDGSSPAAGEAVGIYWVGDSSAGPRLFREFATPTGEDRLLAAATTVVTGQPKDDSYRTEWPGGPEITSVTPTDAMLVVDIGDDAFTEAPDGMSRKMAKLAIQQMVYTLQGVQQERVPVQFLRAGEPARLFGLDLAEPVTEANLLKTLNHMSITTPEQGASVSGGTLTVTGVANSFEAAGQCLLLVADKQVAVAGWQAEGWDQPKLYPFTTELSLTDAGTGDAVVRCETDDPTGGTEGPGAFTDDKLITIN